MEWVALAWVGLFVFLANVDAQVLIDFSCLCRHFLTCNVVVWARRHLFVDELDWKFGRWVFAFAWYTKRHQTLLDHFNAKGFALVDHSVTIIVWYQSIKCLVHLFKLDVLSVNQRLAIELFDQAVAPSLTHTQGFHHLHIFFDHRIRQLHLLTQVNSWRQLFRLLWLLVIFIVNNQVLMVFGAARGKLDRDWLLLIKLQCGVVFVLWDKWLASITWCGSAWHRSPWSVNFITLSELQCLC